MDNLFEAVQRLAYEMWESAGRPEGRSDEFWFSAEMYIKQSLGDPNAAASPLAAREAEPTVKVSPETEPKATKAA